MKALVYRGPGRRLFENRPRPIIKAPTDAIVRVTSATVCGSDLRVMRGDTPRIAHGRILGHDGTGIVERVGDRVANFRVGDHVLISSLTSCGTCARCRSGDKAHCKKGGWMLGSAIDGTYAECVRVPFADHSLFPIPGAGDDASAGPPHGFPGGFVRAVFHEQEEEEQAERASIVFGGPVGIGPVLAVMQYYRDVIHPGMPGGSKRLLEARQHRRAGTPTSGSTAPHSTRRSANNQRLHYIAPARTR